MESFKTSSRWGLVLLLAGLLVAASAQVAGVAKISAAPVNAAPHASVTTQLSIAVAPGFHIQSNHPKIEYLIPSAITITPTDGITVGKVAWPATVERKFSFSPQPLAVFEGQFKVPVTLKTGAAGTHLLHGSFRYQACNDTMCRAPVTVGFTLPVHVR